VFDEFALFCDCVSLCMHVRESVATGSIRELA
jgi:hypothetical protein